MTAGHPETPAAHLREVVERIVEAFDIDGRVTVEDTDEALRVTVEGEELTSLIGRNGATIDAIQHLAARIVFGGASEKRDVVVDADGYRERQATRLHRVADEVAAEAVRNGRPVEMEPMRAAERKVVHRHLQSRADVVSHSEGDEPQRRLVVSPAQSTRPQS